LIQIRSWVVKAEKNYWRKGKGRGRPKAQHNKDETKGKKNCETEKKLEKKIVTPGSQRLDVLQGESAGQGRK